MCAECVDNPMQEIHCLLHASAPPLCIKIGICFHLLIVSLLRVIKRTKRRRCEECGEAFSFVPISLNDEEVSRRQIFALKCRQLLTVTTNALSSFLFFFICLPGMSALMLYLSANTFVDFYALHVSCAYGFITSFIILSVIHVMNWLARVMSEGKELKKRSLRRPVRAIKDSSNWLAQVSPREYRAYLRRREVHRERLERAALGAIVLDEDDDQMHMDDQLSVSSAGKTSVSGKEGKRLDSSQPSTQGISVTVREPFKCKICFKKICIDKDHVVMASIKTEICESPVPSIMMDTAASIELTPETQPLRYASKLRFFIFHTFLTFSLIAAPMWLGGLIVEHFDGFLNEVLRLAVIIANYFMPFLNVHSLNIHYGLKGLVKDRELASQYVIGKACLLMLYYKLRAQNIPTVKTFLFFCEQAVKLCIEYMVVPYALGQALAESEFDRWASGVCLLNIGFLVVEVLRQGTRPGLWFWMPSVFDFSEQGVANVCAESIIAFFLKHASYSLPLYLACLMAKGLPPISLSIPPLLALIAIFTNQGLQCISFVCKLTFNEDGCMVLIKKIVSKLHLSSVIFGGRHAQEERFPSGGKYWFVPSNNYKRYSLNRIRQMMSMEVEPVDIANMTDKSQEGRFRGFSVVYQPRHACKRLFLLALIISFCALSASCIFVYVPVHLGRCIYRQSNDLFNWMIGYALIVSKVQIAKTFMQNHSRLKNTLTEAIKLSIIFSCHVFINPLSLGWISECFQTSFTAKSPLSTPTFLALWQKGLILSICSALIQQHSLKLRKSALTCCLYVLVCTMPPLVALAIGKVLHDDYDKMHVYQRSSYAMTAFAYTFLSLIKNIY